MVINCPFRHDCSLFIVLCTTIVDKYAGFSDNSDNGPITRDKSVSREITLDNAVCVKRKNIVRLTASFLQASPLATQLKRHYADTKIKFFFVFVGR